MSQSAASPRRAGGIDLAGWLGRLLLLALVVLAYAPTLRHGFVWDDHEQIVDNTALRDAGGLPRFFTGDVLSLTRQGDQRSNYYRPLFLCLLWTLYQWFGPAALWWHAAAIAVHGAATLAVHLLLLRLVPPRTAWVAAALFAVHPVHGESVAWLSAAFNDPPAAAFMALALVAHVVWRRDGAWWRLAVATACAGAALGFKESALALPALVLLVERQTMPERSWRTHLLSAGPYLLVVAAYLGLRRWLLGSMLGFHVGPGWGELLPTLPRLVLEYLRFLVWPVGLAPSYPLRVVPGWAIPAAWGSLLACLALGVAAIWATRRQRVPRFAFWWTLACLAPALNIRSFRPAYLVHQRYLYLAVLGVALVLAWAAAHSRVRPWVRRLAIGALLASAIGFNLATNGAWRSDEELWRRVMEVDPGNPAAFDWLGARALDRGDVDAAEGLFRRSLEADSAAPQGACNLAIVLHLRRGQPAAALPLYRRSLAAFAAQTSPDRDRYLDCRLDYAVALAATGQTGTALAELLAMTAAPPHPAAAYRNAAVLLRGRGEVARARALLAEGLARHPADARLAAMAGSFEDSLRHPLP